MTIYLLVGVPSSGKSWVCSQLKDKFNILEHDHYISKDPYLYTNSIIVEAETTDRPMIIETPFSMSQIINPLERAGLEVTPVFIVETQDILRGRYEAREGRDIPQGHLTRNNTYMQRAIHGEHFFGTSEDVYNYLKRV